MALAPWAGSVVHLVPVKEYPRDALVHSLVPAVKDVTDFHVRITILIRQPEFTGVVVRQSQQ